MDHPRPMTVLPVGPSRPVVWWKALAYFNSSSGGGCGWLLDRYADSNVAPSAYGALANTPSCEVDIGGLMEG